MRLAVLLCSVAAVAVGQLTRDALVAHNYYRSMHGAAPLTLAADLTVYAQKWANYLANVGTLIHSSCTLNGERIGENLAMRWEHGNVDISGTEATKLWYDEVVMHNFYNNNFDPKTGHFTQLVWKATTQMGIAKTSKNGKVFVVANYRPAGNYQGQFLNNVGRRV